MPSSAGGSKRSRSASAIVADKASGYHLLKIDGYSGTKVLPTGEALKSCAFTVGGYRWRIYYYPNGRSSEWARYISVFLYLDQQVVQEVRAQHRFRLVDELDDKPPLSLISEEGRIFYGSTCWGQTGFIRREELEKSEHLKNDSFTVRCDIIVANEFRSVETPEATTPPKASFVTVPPPDLHQHLADLLRAEKGADVVFEVGGETFAAHRCVLAARSSVFSAELFGLMKESDTAAGVVRIDDMEAQVFKALLCFVYTDSLPETTKEDDDVMCQHLLVAADRYGMERLKLICEDNMCKHIEVATVATVLVLAEQHHCHGLKKACFDFLKRSGNMVAAMATDSFDHLVKSCPSLIKEIIAMLST